MPTKKDNTTVIEVFTVTIESINAVKRQLAVEWSASVTNPQVIAHVMDFYLKAHQKGKK